MGISELNLTKESLKTKAIKGAGINIATQFAGLICHTAGVIVLGRLLTPKDFGLVAMVTAISLWFMNFGLNGFTEYIMQKEQIRNEDINSIFWLHLLISCILAISFSFFGIFLVKFYSEPALLWVSIAMATSFIFTALFTSHSALLKRNMEFTSIAIVGLVAIILSVVFSIAAAVFGMSYWAIVIRQLTLPVVTVIGAWWLCQWRPTYPKILKNYSALKYAIQVYGNFSIGYVMRNIDKVLLGKFHGTAVLGNYDRAYHLSMMPVGQLLTPLHSVALSTLRQLINEKARFIAYYSKAVAMVSFLGTAAALIITVSANDLILLLLGPTWKESGVVVMAFGPGIAGMLIYGTHAWLHLSLGTPERWLRWNFFSAIITVAGFAIAAPYGGVAMALAYSITAYILIVPALWYAGKPVGLRLKVLVASLWPYFFSAVITFGLWLLLTISCGSFINETAGSTYLLIKILTVSIAVLLLYLIFVFIFQRSLRSVTDVAELIRLFLGRR
jgi:PST family polysaccharide transporter